MPLTTLSAERASDLVSADAALIDLRPVGDYLSGHPRGSISLLYENGPGFGGRARDMLALSARLILCDDGTSDLENAAAMLRGKGFYVAGTTGLKDHEQTTTPEADLEGSSHLTLIDVADPGVVKQTSVRFIPADNLWDEAASLDRSSDIGVLAGWGVRAATAVGILEHLGFAKVTFVRTLPVGSRPPSAGPERNIFRVQG